MAYEENARNEFAKSMSTIEEDHEEEMYNIKLNIF
jgi:hypothetical protein